MYYGGKVTPVWRTFELFHIHKPTHKSLNFEFGDSADGWTIDNKNNYLYCYLHVSEVQCRSFTSSWVSKLVRETGR